jgi:Ca-activated chloride channel family protein
MKTSARLASGSFRFDRPARSHLVVTLTAPALEPAARRPPVCVIPVIDVSGSMQGEKLHRARLSVMKLIDHLGPHDRCGVVTFTSDVRVVAPPAALTPAHKEELKLRVGDLTAQSNTNLSGGMLKGLELANLADFPEGTLVRVILFTDGLANAGVATGRADLLPLLDAHRGRASLSAFGYGQDADQDLLSDLARRGGGNYAFVQGPDDAMAAFARELGGLLSTYAQDLVVRVEPLDGARLLRVLSDVDARPRGAATELRAADILAEEVRHLVLEVELPACAGATIQPAFAVDGRYAALAEGAARERSFAQTVQVARVAPGEEQARPDPELDAVVAQAQLLDAQLRAEAEAERGDFGAAAGILGDLARELRQRGHHAAAASGERMARDLAGREGFQRSAAYRKSMHAGLRRGAASSLHADADRELRSLGKVFGTPAQSRMEESFKDDPAAPDRPATAAPHRRRSGRW